MEVIGEMKLTRHEKQALIDHGFELTDSRTHWLCITCSAEGLLGSPVPKHKPSCDYMSALMKFGVWGENEYEL